MTEHEAFLQRRHRLRDLLHRREKNYKGSKERLAYYRSHGLTDCSDYPGGDAAFKRDVLAGDQRQEKDFTFETKHEDTYIPESVNVACRLISFFICYVLTDECLLIAIK